MEGKKLNEVIKTIKEIKPDTICLFKIGTFYHCYNRDCYIISYLFGYQVRNIEEQVKECGFPEIAINKVKAKLEDKKINYAIFDRRNNYKEEEKYDFKNLNTYNKHFEKAKEYINYKIRIERINNKLLSNIDTKYLKNILNQIERILSN